MPNLPRVQWALIASLLLAVIVANIAQPYPELAPLQHIPTVVLILSGPWLLRRWPLTTRSMVLLWLFLLLHTLGGRYCYSYVPYEGWVADMTGQSIATLTGMQRNGYDRLIHFMFGLLWSPVFAEIAQRHGGSGRRSAWLLGFALVGLGSAIYEIFEWLLSVVVAGDTADYYNGQQGDIWDAQKDMALAQFGSLIAWIAMVLVDGRRARR